MNVVCVLKSQNSSIYNADWVYKLERAVNRNISIPHRFICLSDIELECNFLKLKNDFNGWWNKIQLFDPEFFLGETLYFDLDVVITKPLDKLIHKLRNSESSLFMCQEPGEIANSSIMYWRENYSEIFSTYISNPTYYQKKFNTFPLIGDQAFISNMRNHRYIESLMPSGYISWTDPKSLNLNPNTGLIVFTSIKSKPSKRIFVNDPIIKQHWI
jgi:hypothetical protein